GREVANAIRAVVPNVKVIFMSGYSPELAGRPLTLQSGESFVQKPFDFESLLTTIRKCLDGDQSS
ncbi:MAG TPA: response regulator, partial [Polyangia bacterium]